MQRGAQSGVTLATIPSGVTIDSNGINCGGGSQLLWNGGNSAWAGSSLSITHGFTTLSGFSASFMETGCTMPPTIVTQDNAISGGVSLGVYHCVTSALTIMASGGTVFWTACGS
jgi:hypothetical protein